MDRLALELGIDDSNQLDRLRDGLDEASVRQQQIGGLFDPGIGHKEFQQAIKSMIGALEKIERGSLTDAAVDQLLRSLEKIPPEWRVMFDSFGGELFDFEATARSISVERPNESREASRRLIASLKALDIASPGAGNARRQAKRYIAGIQALARVFRREVPERPVSSSDGSAFNRYVFFWLNECMGEEIMDPTRHIEQALEDEKHWKKVSL